MSAEYAPDEIRQAFDYLDEIAPDLGLEFSGILGTSANGHTYGYHRSRKWDIAYGRDGAGDYSVQLVDDKAGDGDAASALDLKPKTSAGMILMTRRLIDATARRDPRLRALREFFGTVNGRSVTGRDVRTGRVVTADSTHLWHVHLSGLRRFVNDAAAWRAIMDVIAGKPLEEELDMGISESDLRKIIQEAVWDSDGAANVGLDPANPEWSAGNALGYLVRHVERIDERVADLTAKVDALTKAAAAKTTTSAKPPAKP